MAARRLLTDSTIEFPSFIFDPGIHDFVNPENPGFLASVKSTPEDFIVREINSDEKLVVLDNFKIPPPPPPPSALADTIAPCTDTFPSNSTFTRPDPNKVPPLKELISHELYEAVKKLAYEYKTTLLNNHIVDIETFPDKMTRSLLHFSVRLAFPVLCTTTYHNKEGDHVIRVAADTNYKRLLDLLSSDEAERILIFVSTAQENSRLKLAPDPSDEHRNKVFLLLDKLYGYHIKCFTSLITPYQSESSTSKGTTAHIVIKINKKGKQGGVKKLLTKFVLWKRNEVKETNEVLNEIAQLCHCHVNQFRYCGTKDKRAITVQEITAKGIAAERLSRACCHSSCDISIGNFEYVEKPLDLGNHSGNNFKVILRDLKPKEERDDLEHVVTSAIEYTKKHGFLNYYGLQRFSWSMSTPRVGVALLQDDLRAAVSIALLESGRITEEGKELIKKGDFKAALEVLPTHHVMTTERLILQGLKQYGSSDYGCHRALMTMPFHMRQFYLHSLSSVIWNHLAWYRLQEYGLRLVEGDLVLKRKKDRKTREFQRVDVSISERVHKLSSHDIASESYRLEDVVLPLPGSKVTLPSNKVRAKMLEMIGALGASLTAFGAPRLKVSCSGAYRKLMARPKNLSWKLIKSPPGSVPSTTMTTPTTTGPAAMTTPTTPGPAVMMATPPVTEETGISVKLDFDLPTSTYATEFIRELTKDN